LSRSIVTASLGPRRLFSEASASNNFLMPQMVSSGQVVASSIRG
jgi:hypothetical protein